MTISLPSELEQLIAEKIQSGRYHNAIEVIGDALHLLRERDERDAQKREDLRRDLTAGIEQADQGRVAPLNAKETLARVRQARTASEKRES
jgi:antitoxin ParD1/3/4